MANDVIDRLQDLIQICRDGQQGYKEAAEQAQDQQLKHIFNEESLRRAQFAGELEAEVQRLGKPDPDRSGSVAGTLHRKWLDLRAKLSSGDHGLLEVVEQGEDSAKAHYEKALHDEKLPQNVLAIIQRQSQSIFAAHDRAKRLRDSKAA